MKRSLVISVNNSLFRCFLGQKCCAMEIQYYLEWLQIVLPTSGIFKMFQIMVYQSYNFHVFENIYVNFVSLVAQRLKHLPPMRETPDSIPGLGRSPGEGNGNPLQYSCLENPMDRGAWWAIIHGVAKSQIQLSD